jgi:Fe-S-cluster containining protein
MENMARHLGISLDEFVAKYARKIEGKWALRERVVDHSCIFLYDKSCRVYEVRPKQCRTFPFWKSALESKEAWNDLKKTCEGIREDAPLITQDEIDAQLHN